MWGWDLSAAFPKSGPKLRLNQLFLLSEWASESFHTGPCTVGPASMLAQWQQTSRKGTTVSHIPVWCFHTLLDAFTWESSQEKCLSEHTQPGLFGSDQEHLVHTSQKDEKFPCSSKRDECTSTELDWVAGQRLCQWWSLWALGDTQPF